MSKLDAKLAAKGAANEESESTLQGPLQTVTAERDALLEGQANNGTQLAEARAAERKRITEIMESDQGKAKPKLAMRFAMTTDMSAEEVSTFMEGDLEDSAPVNSAEDDEAKRKVLAKITGPAAAGTDPEPSDDTKADAERSRMKANTKGMKRG